MKALVIFLYRIYQIVVCVPVVVIATILMAVEVALGCTFGNGHFWGYYPGKWTAWIVARVFLLPVTVEGRENLEDNQSYIFIANHQGAFDIFLVYGFLNRNFKWMMKYQLERIPFVGYACRKSHQIFVDKRSVGKVRAMYEKARDILNEGNISVMVFPEGARTYTGHMGKFQKGAFALADELQLPVVPITLDGPFEVMPRMRDWHFVKWHPLHMVIHQPVYPIGKGLTNIQATMKQSYDSVMSSLPDKYKGTIENEDSSK